jgi:hypothetical protein
LLVAMLGIALLAFGCESSSETADPSGGETHFLTVCGESSDCGDTLSCLSGICTRSCNLASSCQPFPGAECTATSEPNAPNYCDVPCSTDAPCKGISELHRCVRGACRSGAVCDGSRVTSNQVLVIGDSFFAASHQITAYLEDLARNAGSLSPGERYRDNSSLLDNTLAGGGIADQYSSAGAEAEVKVVVMNGGGADALLSDCDTASPDCPGLADAISAAEELLVQMAEGGVENVVYAFYPNAVDTSTRAKVDALRPSIQAACERSTLPCHWLDLRPVFEGRYAEYILPDGMNPTSAGAQATAAAIWDVLTQNCIAQ